MYSMIDEIILENFNLVEIIVNIDIVNTVYNIAISNLTWPGSSPKSPLPLPLSI